MSERKVCLAEYPCANKACDSHVVIEQNWIPPEVNDSGGYILECDACKYVFHVHIGKGILSCRVISGARVIEVYDEEIESIDDVLARSNIKSDRHG
jgi:hypothetical protein